MEPAFAPGLLQREILDIPSPGTWIVGLSGGADSVALLHAITVCELPAGIDLRCVHVDHGLHPRAAAWAGFCEAYCDRLGVPCRVVRVDAVPTKGESPEAVARTARYGALADLLPPGGTLLTAHHRDDQAETFLLQALRGAGPAGLSAMPALARFGGGWLARPLLRFGREALRAYVAVQGLDWVDDPTNRETGYDRNFLRHMLMPRIRERWPAASRTLSRAAALQAAASADLEDLARADLARVRDPLRGTLSATGLSALRSSRRARVLRLWIEDRDLPMPTFTQMQGIDTDVLGAVRDAIPCVHWPGGEVRRYRDRLYAMRPLPAHDPTRRFEWDTLQPLEIPDLGIVLTREMLAEGGIPLPGPGGNVTVCFRQGGECCAPAGRGHRHRLKKLFQEAGVPPWERDRIPLIRMDGRLTGVVGYWACR